ncbi:hypothetical protein FBUS_07434 [Fasciolopsis buskii]|uniref:Uncharacterized protein n=1 Tax=Fasciolopsis buskii TaxID=27845 RepID=A0A8E0VHU2_9TREM|nr:hypothetical protein FBUS_07434 [Fasciolopsis buski]
MLTVAQVILNKLGGTTTIFHSPDVLRKRRILPTSMAEPPLRMGTLLPTDGIQRTRINWLS